MVNTVTTQPRSRLGLNRLKARVKLQGLDVIDRRTSTARALLRWREELIRDLGGIDNISAQRLALVELATRTRLLVEHADGFLLECRSIINKRRKAFLPIVLQRQTLCDSLARLLSQLGLERRPKPVPTLRDYLREKESSAGKTEGDSHAGVVTEGEA